MSSRDKISARNTKTTPEHYDPRHVGSEVPGSITAVVYGKRSSKKPWPLMGICGVWESKIAISNMFLIYVSRRMRGLTYLEKINKLGVCKLFDLFIHLGRVCGFSAHAMKFQSRIFHVAVFN